MSDTELLARYKDTHDNAFLGELYNRYIPLVYGTCLKYLKNRESAQDAVMQIFEDLLDKTLQHTVQNFKSWLYILTKNHCLSLLRKNSKTTTINIDHDVMDFTDDFRLDSIMEDERRTKILEDCIKQLPDEQSRSIVKFYIENFTYVEICESTGYELNKVKSYIQNGKRNLKLCLERKGIKSAAAENVNVS